MDLTIGNIRFIPCIHRRVTFAQAVRRAALEWRPDAIAVELPDTLSDWIVRGVMRLPRISAVAWEEVDRPGELGYLPIDPCDGLVEAVRLGCEHDIDLAFIDLDLPGLQEPHVEVPDDQMIDRTGLEAYVATVAPHLAASRTPASVAREAHMARLLRDLSQRHERVLCVLGMAHFLPVRERLRLEKSEIADEQILPTIDRREARLLDVDPRSLLHVLGEMPYLTHLWNEARAESDRTALATFEKLDALQSIFKQAERTYRETYKETVSLTQWKALLQYTRNLALIRGALRPRFYEMIVGARGIVDGDYGCEVYELAKSYPPQDDDADDLPRLTIRHDRAIVEGREQKFRLHPRCEDPPRETIQLRFRRRPSHELKLRWKEQWQQMDHRGICSYPPEDELQERFMDFLRKRALQVVTEDRKQVREFSTSMLDGLDIRETMRNWHTGKLYVQSTPQPRGRVGAVVLIFQDEPLAFEPTWRTTLYAEHQNESDISFFATPLGEHVVGPRISRTEFGGILSVYPAWGIPDIWSLGLGGRIRWCSEALGLAALLFSPHRYIAYVAAEPPRSWLCDLARNYRRHFVYLPRHMFSDARLKKIRRFHILNGRDVRAWARDYIFDD